MLARERPHQCFWEPLGTPARGSHLDSSPTKSWVALATQASDLGASQRLHHKNWALQDSRARESRPSALLAANHPHRKTRSSSIKAPLAKPQCNSKACRRRSTRRNNCLHLCAQNCSNMQILENSNNWGCRRGKLQHRNNRLLHDLRLVQYLFQT